MKATVIAAGAAGLGARMWFETREANRATRQANEAETSEEYDRYSAERDARLNARDSAVSWLLLLWSYNMVDAYVEGHFVGFDGLQLRILGAEPATPSALPIASIRFQW